MKGINDKIWISSIPDKVVTNFYKILCLDKKIVDHEDIIECTDMLEAAKILNENWDQKMLVACKSGSDKSASLVLLTTYMFKRIKTWNHLEFI